MGMRVTCRQSAARSGGELLSFDFWMRGGATPSPMHVHPHQEERITVVSGSVRFRSGAADRVLSPGDTLVSPPGESHTVGPAGNEDVVMVAELRPALTYEQFMERSFALDRADYAKALQQAMAFDVFILEYPGYGDRSGAPDALARIVRIAER